MIAGPVETFQLVLLARSNGEGDVDDRLVARTVFVFGGGLLHDFGHGRAELGFQVSALEIDGKKLVLDELMKSSAGIFAVAEAAAGGFERGHIVGRCSGEFKITDADENVVHVIGDRLDGAVLFAGAEIFDVSGDRPFDQHGLEHVGNFVGEAAEKRQLAVEERGMLLDALAKFVIGKPDEIFEAGGDKFLGVGDMQLELGSRGGVGKAVGDFGEDSHVSEAARGSLKVVVVDGGAHLQSGGGGNGPLGVALASDDFDGDQLAGGGGHLRERLLGRLAEAGQCEGGEKQQQQKSEEDLGGHFDHRLDHCRLDHHDLGHRVGEGTSSSRGFVFHRDVDEGEGGAAEGFVFAEDQGKVAADLGVGDGDGGEHFGANVFFDVGAGNEADADVGGDEALEQFAGVKFHGEVGLEAAVVKKLLDGVAGVSGLGDDQRELGDIGHGGRLHLSEGMLRRSDDDQLVAMDEDDGEAGVGDGKGDDAEVDGVVDDGFENLAVVGALDVHRDVGILLFEVGKNVGQDVEAGAFVGADDDFAARDALHFGDGDQHGFAGVEGVFDVFLEGLAGRSEGNFAAGAVKQFGADFFLQAADLRGNCWLGAETFLRGARERGVPGHFEECFELVEIHKAAFSYQLSAVSRITGPYQEQLRIG